MAFGTTMKGIGLTLGLLLAGGCYGGAGDESTAPDEENTATAAEAIRDGSPASDYASQRAVVVVTERGHKCTGTIISKRHVLTAAHCKAARHQVINGTKYGTYVNFYGTSTLVGTVANGNTRYVTQVLLPPGVDPANDELDDFHGDYADFAVLTLNADIPDIARVAPMLHYFVGEDVWGTLVGRGLHEDGQSSYPYNTLLSTNVPIESSSDSDGEFHLDGIHTDAGDSGGPFYTAGKRVMGVLSGIDSGLFDDDTRYTSVPHHLPRILNMIDYQTTLSLHSNAVVSGTLGTFFFTPSHDTCAYACEKDTTCAGFTYYMGACYQYWTASGTAYLTGAYSGLK